MRCMNGLKDCKAYLPIPSLLISLPFHSQHPFLLPPSTTDNVCSGLAFDRNDPSTIHNSKLPLISEKGLCMHYALPHEDFVWRIRSDQGVIEAWEKVYDDPDLI